ncbi:barren [Phellopilus nigrolimitatus]|nr:barren [Phellopilus nigrolimitatus]
MARAARTKAQTHQPLYADSDSDGGENSDYEATPRAKRVKGKKRVSDVFQPVAAPADSSSPPNRVPFMTVNINDDEAEKRKRRKSAKQPPPMMLVDDAEAGPSSQDGANAGDTPKASRNLKNKQQLMSVAEAPVINVPLDVMSSNFEEWMKMATDNKINAANSWSFALIDYFHDMSLLRNNVDNSINFQKASCTLDGCVKIWTSRVDSVGTETGKLLSNLASEGKADEDEGALSDNPDSNDPSQRKRTKTHRAESTLAKHAAQLRSKKLDLEFSVDPLFKKTCADFDEGGAQGLLMNHLSLGVGSEGSMRVIFDASDSMGKGKGDDEDPADVEPPDDIDLSHIRSEFLPDLTILEDKAIAHSLEGFSFSKDSIGPDSSNFMSATYADDDDDDDDVGDGGFGDDAGAPMDVDGGFVGGEDGGDVQDFFVGDQAVGDDYGGGFEMDQGPIGDDPGGDDEVGVQAQHGARTGGFEPFDPKRVPNERDLILAMTEPGANGSSLDYFDQTFLKNWAGPEHWKLRKVIRRPEATADTIANKSKQREKKEPFKIDFLTPATKSQKEISKEIFAPVTKGGSITLPQFSKKKGRKGKEKEKKSEQTLPDDMHFSSRQLVTLFLKPKFALKMRGNRARLNENDGEVDENFWAQAAANQAAGRSGEEGEESADGGAVPFNTQFFHDEYDDGPGFDDIYDGDGDGMVGNPDDVEPGERDLLSETQGQSRRVRPETVNYARRAKRVDVRKLKENIWKGLDIIIPPSQEVGDGDEDIPMETPDDRTPTDPEDARVFTSVISDLQGSYPKDKMDDISTSFCFICLLHLANERGLKLEVGDEDEVVAPQNVVEETEETKVGNIWGLKVFRDPTALPSS